MGDCTLILLYTESRWSVRPLWRLYLAKLDFIPPTPGWSGLPPDLSLPLHLLGYLGFFDHLDHLDLVAVTV